MRMDMDMDMAMAMIKTTRGTRGTRGANARRSEHAHVALAVCSNACPRRQHGTGAEPSTALQQHA